MLNPGARLGSYEVLAKLGEGGMGEVYRARDTKLGRDVALKILPESVAGDPDRLMRFEREAKTLAALNHPNIAAIYGVEGAMWPEGPASAGPEAGGLTPALPASGTALVMELVEGDDLSQRVARGAMPLEEAVPIARQIAEAMEAAHDAGIIHRDLKPANVKVRPDGLVKVLDFGLAKALDPATEGAGGAGVSPPGSGPAHAGPSSRRSALPDRAPTLVGSMESAPVYADPGWLVFARRDTLAAVAFDAHALRVSGEPIPLLDGPANLLDSEQAITAGRATSISANGTLAYFSTVSRNTVARWYDATGQLLDTLNLPPGYYSDVAVSPDGLSAVVARSISPAESELWLVDLRRGGLAQQLSSGRGLNATPIWSSDSTRVLFTSDRDGPLNIYVKTIGDTSPEQPFYESPVLFKYPSIWSGDTIVFVQVDEGSAQNVYTLDASSLEPAPLVVGPGAQHADDVSPDGKWMTFTSSETGADELYVTSFPQPGRSVRVSLQGSSRGSSWWTLDMRQILYLGPDSRTLWQVDIEPGQTIRPGTPRPVATFPARIQSMSATPDRTRFLVVEPERAGGGSITVVQHALADLRR